MATIREIVLGLREALLAVQPDMRRIYVVGRRPNNKLPNLVGDRDILIRPRGFTVGDVAGAGRSNTIMRRLVDIVLRDRLMVDQSEHDLQWLTKEAVGHLAYEDRVIDALQMWLGNAADNELLLVGEGEPARLVAGSDAERDFQAADGKWGASVLTLEVVYRQELNQDVQ
jgi:hypothetical protein